MGRWFRIAAVAAVMLAAGGAASAQSPFPSKPVHIFVPYAAGGAVDILTRTLGDVVSKQWGQIVVVENRPGAGGVIASQALAASPPDGYTLIMVASGHATNPFLYPKIPYDTFKDFTPISLLASSPNILLVRADSPFKTLADVIAQARAKPGSLSYGPCRHRNLDPSRRRTPEEPRQDRSQRHPLQGRRARDQRSPGRANSDVVQQRPGIGRPDPGRHACARSRSRPPGGRRSCPMCRAWPRPCRATTPRCGGACSDPAGMPPDLVAKLSHDFVAALNTEAVKERLAKLGASPIGSSPQEFDAKIHADYEKWGPIIKAAGMKAE